MLAESLLNAGKQEEAPALGISRTRGLPEVKLPFQILTSKLRPTFAALAFSERFSQGCTVPGVGGAE